jgi:predicted tellurium resistance membrane protein TerC
VAGLLGLGSTSLAIALARYRWVFVFLAVVWLIIGFKLKVLRPASRVSRVLYWSAAVFTVITILHWGWWRL